jgi:hypothetical protein
MGVKQVNSIWMQDAKKIANNQKFCYNNNAVLCRLICKGGKWRWKRGMPLAASESVARKRALHECRIGSQMT